MKTAVRALAWASPSMLSVMPLLTRRLLHWELTPHALAAHFLRPHFRATAAHRLPQPASPDLRAACSALRPASGDRLPLLRASQSSAPGRALSEPSQAHGAARHGL